MNEPRTFPEQVAPEDDNWLTSPPPPPPGAAEPTVIVPPDPTETVPTKTAASTTPSGGRSAHGAVPAGAGPTQPRPGFREVLSRRADQLHRGLDGLSSGWLWLGGGASVVAAYALAWLVALILTVRHEHALTAQGRLLTLFEPGAVAWAVACLLGVALIAAGRRLDGDPVTGRQAGMVLSGLLVMAATIFAAALLGILVELANFGHGIAPTLAGIVARIAVLPVAGVAGAWAWHALGHHRS